MSSVPYEEFYKKFYNSKQDLEQKRSRLFLSSDKLKLTDENVTSSIFLACLVGIREFCEDFFASIGFVIKKNYKVHAFSQVEFADNDGLTPDGILVVTEGKSNPVVVWVGLLEFKTKSDLDKTQIEKYATIARNKKYGFNAVITVSNDFVSNPLYNPFGLKNYKNMEYFHFSWVRIQSMLEYRIQQGISDEDQVYLAEQYALYMRDHKEIKSFDSMNPKWSDQIKLLKLERSFNKNKHKDILEQISNDWLQEEQDIGLKVKANYGKEIKIKSCKGKEVKACQETRISLIKNNLLASNKFVSEYEVKPSREKFSLFRVSKKKCLNIVNEVLLDTGLQNVYITVDNSECNNKTFKKNLEYFLEPLVKMGPAFSDFVSIEINFKGKSEKLIKKVSQYIDDMSRNDILSGFGEVDSKASITSYKIIGSYDINKSLDKPKKFIETIETNFIDFYSQYIEYSIEF